MEVIRWETSDRDRLLCARLNRPKANVLDREMILALQGGLESRVGPHTHALVIGHEGPNFSFGASVAEHQAEQVAGMFSSFHGLFRYLDRISLPILAGVSGFCLGGGFELALFCHFLFLHPDSKLGQPEIKLGVFPPMASLLLSAQHAAASHQINLTGRTFSGSEMAAFGLATGLAEDPWEAALDYARRHLLDKSVSSLRLAVRANRLGLSRALEQDLPRLEQLYLEELMSTRDANEGIAAFLEKREPVWRDE